MLRYKREIIFSAKTWFKILFYFELGKGRENELIVSPAVSLDAQSFSSCVSSEA